MSIRTWDELDALMRQWVADIRARWHWLEPRHFANALRRLKVSDWFFLDEHYRTERRKRQMGFPYRLRLRIPIAENGLPSNLMELSDGESKWEYLRGRWAPYISREELEEHLQVWPGFLDGMELAYDAVQDALEAIRLQAAQEIRKIEEARAESVRRVQVAAEMQEARIRQQFRVGRHAHLEHWRRSNPTSGARPACLERLTHAKRLIAEQPCHVYFLLRAGEVVYVGKTASAWPGRIENHVREAAKDFDDVWYIEVDAGSLDAVEAHYIREYRPRYNMTLRSQEPSL